MKINLQSLSDYILRPIKSAPEEREGLSRLTGSIALGVLTLGASHLLCAARDYLHNKKVTAEEQKEKKVSAIFQRELENYINQKPPEGATREEINLFLDKKIGYFEGVLKKGRGTEDHKQLISTALNSLKMEKASRSLYLRDLFNHEFDYPSELFSQKLQELLALHQENQDFIIQKIELLEKAQQSPQATDEERKLIQETLLKLAKLLDD